MNSHRFGYWLGWFAVIALAVIPLGAQAQDSALELSQTFDNGQSSFRYPEGWGVREVGPLLSLATDESVVETGTDLASGDMRATVFIGPLNELPFLDPDDASIDNLIKFILDFEVAATCKAFSRPCTNTLGEITVTTPR